MKVLHHFQHRIRSTLWGLRILRLETLQHALSLIPVKLCACCRTFWCCRFLKPISVIIAQVGGRLLVARSRNIWASHWMIWACIWIMSPKTLQYKVSNLDQVQLRSLERLIDSRSNWNLPRWRFLF